MTGTGKCPSSEKKGVNQLFITGLTTEYCVKTSALDAVKKGFDTFVLSYAVAGINANEGDEDRAFHEMKKAGVTVI